jgi:hypothetical protein
MGWSLRAIELLHGQFRIDSGNFRALLAARTARLSNEPWKTEAIGKQSYFIS